MHKKEPYSQPQLPLGWGIMNSKYPLNCVMLHWTFLSLVQSSTLNDSLHIEGDKTSQATRVGFDGARWGGTFQTLPFLCEKSAKLSTSSFRIIIHPRVKVRRLNYPPEWIWAWNPKAFTLQATAICKPFTPISERTRQRPRPRNSLCGGLSGRPEGVWIRSQFLSLSSCWKSGEGWCCRRPCSSRS